MRGSSSGRQQDPFLEVHTSSSSNVKAVTKDGVNDDGNR